MMEPHRKPFAVFVTAVLLCCVSSDEEWEAVGAKKGDSVTLTTKDDGCDRGAQVVWMFGPQSPNTRIARVKDGEQRTNFSDHFKDRLQLDRQSGSLRISGLTFNDSGIYMCRSISSKIYTQRFNLSVYAPVCAPSIKINSSEVSTSCSSLLVECSVQNSRELRLSWFRGRDRLRETSGPDMSSRLILSLSVESSNGDEYSCVAENPVDQRSSRLLMEDTCLNHGGMMKHGDTALVLLLLSISVL
ncbi:uncharacterized protein LOC117816164 isoform X1 [Xyrichtys novacula]|uniref:Uncharacterized protein LOC117816164 isoform X1 n=1 Tax=Xyrichtys novacula TaxID=13765 RepID=A0AAV1EXF6_XYRNO|nr:uncharacterized protein LOC117816164 isoform X1 [Xyrichtys novacula]